MPVATFRRAGMGNACRIQIALAAQYEQRGLAGNRSFLYGMSASLEASLTSSQIEWEAEPGREE
jgi:hypothetical protein